MMLPAPTADRYRCWRGRGGAARCSLLFPVRHGHWVPNLWMLGTRYSLVPETCILLSNPFIAHAALGKPYTLPKYPKIIGITSLGQEFRAGNDKVLSRSNKISLPLTHYA